MKHTLLTTVAVALGISSFASPVTQAAETKLVAGHDLWIGYSGAFVTGQLDAAVTWEPWGTKAKSVGGNCSFWQRPGAEPQA